MTGIDRVRTRSLPAHGGNGGAKARGDGAFAAMLTPNDGAEAAAEAAAPAGLSGTAWVQAGMAQNASRAAQDREARKHGRALLAALAGLQRAALGGDGNQAQAALAALAATVGDVRAADDPALQVILREIAVRAAVELARAAPQTQP